jgi:ATP-binding cassette, subfamily B, heavy metal transporter
MKTNEKNKLKEKINFKYNTKEYLGFLKKYKSLFILLLIVTFFVEATSIADKYLFKIIIDNGTLYSSGGLAENSFISILLIVALIFGIMLIFKTIGRWFHLHLINKLDYSLILDLKKKYFNHIISLSYNFHTTHRTGSLISRLARGRSAIEGLTDIIIFNFVPLIFQLSVLIITLIYLDFISAIIISSIVLVFILYNFFIQTLQNESNLSANDKEDYEKAIIGDYLTNIESIKYFGKENAVKKKFSDVAQESGLERYRNWSYFRWLDSGQALILGIGTFLVIYFPLLKFLDGTLSLGTLVFIYTSYSTIVSSMFGFVYGLRRYYSVMSDLNALFLYGKIENEIKDKPDAKNLKINKGIIEFKDVNFNYGKRKIFENFSLKIPEKKIVAFVGHSGSGKTSLIKLLYRLYDLDSGQILIDGKNINEFKQDSIRNEMSIVPQECVLFNDTIFNNISFSNSHATREEVISAIKFSQLDKTISNFPDKENTLVGERGVKLSGGEKQRVSIARALLANKKVLIFDEATSSLDSRTESEIQEDLKNLMKGRTTIVIAHRLSTIMNADMIVVMDKGKIVQMGNHKELIRKSGEYKNLWNLQKGGYIR